ncbi:MAG TPA: hypothetical protein VGM52_08475 [Herbaspirillum sp.]|jgi:hypothetical protein
MNEINLGNMLQLAQKSALMSSQSKQTGGISVSNLIGNLHLNLTQPECSSPVSDLPPRH